jgi:hypothetical protein
VLILLFYHEFLSCEVFTEIYSDFSSRSFFFFFFFGVCVCVVRVMVCQMLRTTKVMDIFN